MFFDTNTAVLDAPPSRDSSRTPTSAAVEAAQTCGADVSERALLDAAVAAVLAEFPGGGLVDSYAVASVLFERRVAAGKEPCATQTKDYVQYLFRETSAHVCRHADGHHYRVHAEESCSQACDDKYSHAAPVKRREACTSCFMELTTAGECPMGC